MLSNYLIGLREGLEATLIIAILVAYLVSVGERTALRRLWIGVGAAVAVAIGFGAFLQLTSQSMSEKAQEAFGGIVSLIAVGLITWMIFWMAKHARELRGHLHGELNKALTSGGGWAVAVVAFVAVIREGLETALFLWAGIKASGSDGVPLTGAVLGLLTAIAIGVAVYFGAVRLNMGKLFTWTGYALIIVAAGVLSYAIHELQEAGLLPGEDATAFDVSAQMPPGTPVAALLQGTINFSPTMSWLQVIAWIAYVVPTLYFYTRVVRGRPSVTKAGNAPTQAAERATTREDEPASAAASGTSESTSSGVPVERVSAGSSPQ